MGSSVSSNTDSGSYSGGNGGSGGGGHDDSAHKKRQAKLDKKARELEAKAKRDKRYADAAERLRKKQENEAAKFTGSKGVDKISAAINAAQSADPSRMQASQDVAIIRSNIAKIPGMTVKDSRGNILRSSSGAAILTSAGKRMLDEKGYKYGDTGTIKATAAQEISQMKFKSAIAPGILKPFAEKLFNPSTVLASSYQSGNMKERKKIEKDLKLGDKKITGTPKGHESVLQKNLLLSGKDRKAFLLGETEKLLKGNLGD